MTPFGLARRHILFFEDITTREVWCGGITKDPDGNFMAQVARNQVDCLDGKLNDFKYIIHDNDTLFSGRFTDILLGAGCKTKHTRPFCPEQNGYVESFVKTFKTECLDQLILTSDEQLRYVVKEFLWIMPAGKPCIAPVFVHFATVQPRFWPPSRCFSAFGGHEFQSHVLFSSFRSLEFSFRMVCICTSAHRAVRRCASGIPCACRKPRDKSQEPCLFIVRLSGKSLDGARDNMVIS